MSIVRSLPYDRPGTSMQAFVMCDACRREYDDPLDRRFHAQPNACPDCGPQLELWDAKGVLMASAGQALEGAAEAMERGEVIAVLGIGGFHLMVDACNTEALRRLREGKPRREKPFALMVRDLGQARRLCHVDEAAEAVLRSPESPIVLLPRRADAGVDDAVAPGNPRLGLMLPATPLHHLLMRRLGHPIVATSGNLSEEPICTEGPQAVQRLAGVADRFLVHDRRVVRHVDDSVTRMLGSEPTLLRRARGYAPRPVLLAEEVPCLLAVGGHLKNTAALSVGRQVFVSQHIGDMETPQALRAFERVVDDFLRLYEAKPTAIAHDLHPEYATTTWVQDAVAAPHGPRQLRGLPLISVQHHHAHLAACLAEHGFEGSVLGVTWDGTGYGTDGTIWGGEFLVGSAAGFRRAAHLRSFRLPGGEAAVREPRRPALALLWALGGRAAFDEEELPPLRAFADGDRALVARMLERGVNAPETSSAGRLFDAVAAFLGLHQRCSYEGQAAMALEYVADRTVDDLYPVALREDPEFLVVDWEPTLRCLLEDLGRGTTADVVSARFHNTLAEAILLVARAVGKSTVALTGGCFQNELLVDRTLSRLRASGFEVLLHRQIPPNDGGISLGQIAVAAALLRQGTGGTVAPGI
jgi:hydrogenase maturation protein HypF